MRSALFLSAAMLAVGCGQFSEFTVNVATLQGNEITTGLFVINGNNVNRNIEIQNVRVIFESITLNGDKFQNVLVENGEADLAADGDDVDLLDAEVFDADKNFQEIVVVIDEIQVDFDIDRDGVAANANEAQGTVLLENLGLELTFDNFEFNSVKSNVDILLEMSAKDIVAGIDFQDGVNTPFDAAANTFFIDADAAPNAADIAQQNVEDFNFFKGNYVLNVQNARVKP